MTLHLLVEGGGQWYVLLLMCSSHPEGFSSWSSTYPASGINPFQLVQQAYQCYLHLRNPV